MSDDVTFAGHESHEVLFTEYESHDVLFAGHESHDVLFAGHESHDVIFAGHESDVLARLADGLLCVQRSVGRHRRRHAATQAPPVASHQPQEDVRRGAYRDRESG